MNILKRSLLLLFLFYGAASCSIEPQPIDYGYDACHYCKMNIVDNQHAAETVTQKGKAFKYDAIECMIHDSKKRNENEIALFLITDYTIPGKLVDATQATYLISENLPSPMGANITGFENKYTAKQTQKEKQGTLLTWAELKNKF